MFILVTYDEFDHDTDHEIAEEADALKALRDAAACAYDDRICSPALYGNNGTTVYDLEDECWYDN
jgi:hypothetical protein